MKYDQYIGQEVIHIHRSDYDQNYQAGKLVSILHGVNCLLGVQWNGNEYTTWMPPQDIALKSTYPKSRF